MFVVHNVTHSFWGRAFEAIKYSAVAAESCGISRSYFKIAAFVLSAAIAGLAGGFFTQLDPYVAPNTFTYDFSVAFLIALIFGGVRSVLGNVIGVALVVILPDLFNRFADYRLMVYGTLLLLVLYFMPEGVVGIGRRIWRRFRPRGPRPPSAPRWTRPPREWRCCAGRRQSEGPPALELEGRGDAVRGPPRGAGSSIDHPPERGPRAHRPERERQDHHRQRDHRPLHAHRGPADQLRRGPGRG